MTQSAPIPVRPRTVFLLGCVVAALSACFTEVRVIETGSAGSGGGGTASDDECVPASTMACDDPSDLSTCWNPFYTSLNPIESSCPTGFVPRNSVLGGQAGGRSPSGTCTRGGACLEVDVSSIDKVDLLFVIDNSGSMTDEQQALSAQFPRLLTALTTGDADGDGVPDFPPARDIHFGVVSTDMGSPGVTVDAGASRLDGSCSGLGDDGLWQHEPSALVAHCNETYPAFLAYHADFSDRDRTAMDMACLATIGTAGCGFEQPLEAALKALWPAHDVDPTTGLRRITFLGDTDGGITLGHGDGKNQAFLRNDVSQGISVVSVVVVTNEDDCSSVDPSIFMPAELLHADHPLASQPLQLRCHENAERLYPITRYVHGLRALRPGRENLVLFTVIAGVPPGLVSPAERSLVDFDDPASGRYFYDRILDDWRMQAEVVMVQSEDDGESYPALRPSCSTESRRAYPPRRLVETARAFGPNGLALSICDSDLGPAADAPARQIGKHTGAACPPVYLVRAGDGRVACDVLWELPPPGQAGPNTPASCGAPAFEFLSPDDRKAEGPGELCKVTQMGVVPDFRGALFVRPEPGAEQGWYYDDFSAETAQECRPGHGRRIAFTPDAKPPTGVRVYLDCAGEATPR
jgi:hypothetical protein